MTDALRLDSDVRCGVVMAGGSRDDVLSLSRRIETLGFDSIWAGDHISFHVPIIESITLLSFVAAATERVRLGTGVYLLPLRHPSITAKTTAALDRLSGGRLTLGVGVGGEFAPEFEATGIPLRERGSRTDESIPLLRRLWTEDGVAHEGRHFRFAPVSLDPKPLQPGGPPIWVGGRSPAAMRRAGRLGDGYISTMTSTERYAKNLAAIEAEAAACGRAPCAFGTGALLFTVLGDAYEPALERAATMLGTIYRRDFREAAARYCLLGRPEDCLEQLERFVDAGCRHFTLSPLSDPSEFLERVAEGILPELRSLAPGR
ncbi:MAG: LLM class flavin-dependent oxidoreductase [Deltaproteobacteria bacterium]|nr:MAG: LLM class flavin-dependent oxidoreductase [Deltaproteobacteria bacterium]